VVAKVRWRERLSISKWAAENFGMDGVHFKKLNDVEVKEEYQVQISNRFVAFET
jgi:hypothetical protein